MDNNQFKILNDKLNKIEGLLLNIQPKKRIKQTKIIDERCLEDQLQDYRNLYAPSMIADFLLYWEEGERWKKEKVFELGSRLKRWKRQEDKWNFEKSQRNALKQVNEQPIEKKERPQTGFSKLF